MEEKNEELVETQDESILMEDGLMRLDVIKPLLEIEMVKNKLNMYMFDTDEIQKYHNVKRTDFSIVLLAKNKDNALYNLKNLKRCYAVKSGM